jgi:hypothetical protein
VEAKEPMSKKTKVVIKHNGEDVPCWFSKMTWVLGDVSRKPCPLCEENIKDGDVVHLIINNYILFPNTVCHDECVEKPNEKLVRILMEDYEKAKAAVESAKNWFPDVLNTSVKIY